MDHVNELIKKMSLGKTIVKEAPDFRHNLLDKLNEQRHMSCSSLNSVCDMIIQVDSQEFYVHKCIMIASCDFFAAMERSGMQETRQTRIELKGLSAFGITNVIEFIYTGELKLNTSNIEDVLRAVSHLQVQHAIKLCEEFICEQLNETNCIDMLNLVDIFCMESVKENINLYILRNFDKLVANDQYKRFSLEQMSSFLQSNRLKLYPVNIELLIEFQLDRKLMTYFFRKYEFSRHVLNG
jgi:hypothetical protein